MPITPVTRTCVAAVMLTATLGAAMLSGCAAVVVGGAATGVITSVIDGTFRFLRHGSLLWDAAGLRRIADCHSTLVPGLFCVS